VRIPTSLAWFLLGATFLTSAMLRQFHDRTPEAPHVSPIVGSALFAAIFLLLLVTARERRIGAVPGKGVRLASLTPILLILLIEKWVSIGIYPVVFERICSPDLDAGFQDALFRAFAGISLIAICAVIGWVSLPTMRKTWRRARPSRWPAAAVAILIVIASGYIVLGGLSALLDGGLQIQLPAASSLLLWVIVGQSVLAFAEELYYRGLLLCEMERLAPRLGIRSAALRRWVALLSTSLLFGLEHLSLGPPWGQALRELTFVISLGLLFGILVMISSNLHFVGGVHAWINWMLLGAAPYYVNAAGRDALPAGTYIGLTLILAFVLTYGLKMWRRRFAYREPLLES